MVSEFNWTVMDRRELVMLKETALARWFNVETTPSASFQPSCARPSQSFAPRRMPQPGRGNAPVGGHPRFHEGRIDRARAGDSGREHQRRLPALPNYLLRPRLARSTHKHRASGLPGTTDKAFPLPPGLLAE